MVIAGSGANTYSGDTIVNAGVLNVQKCQGLGSGGVSVAAGAEIQLQGNITLSNAMLTLAGSGAGPGITGALHNVSGNNVCSGDISLSYGTLTGSTMPGVNVYDSVSTYILSDAGTLTINGNILGTTNSNDQLILGGAGNCVVNGTISGNGSLAKIGTGSLIFSGTDSYTGGTNVNAGTLYVTNSNAIADGTSLSVGAGGTLIYDPSQAVAGSMQHASQGKGLAVAPVPEPGTLALLIAGAVVGLAVWRSR